ncbi:hypothetical protein [Natrarchaeobaculum sulfurireducens]|uniref:Uncharacterized protein n=1 Tax=Natrarchaeobaculum sulfurireducens TaxID=2044521 RepID=A0A346PB72_9EURY|nr:hypothetical protein [Natrarchaeobaculum sulfurireducens]AXR76767.1 hypothetical protein AArc1_0423 [Natrarchaeobaculum sulfurireducens]
MSDTHRWPPERVLVAVILASVAAVVLATLRFDVGPRQLTVGTGVVAAGLVITSIALPAWLLSKWQAEQP